MGENKNGAFTNSGTNIDEVKKNNENSGMTYNEVKHELAKKTGSQDDGSYSQTDIAEVKKKNQQSMELL